MAILTFLSDFGSNSPYPAAMKAVAASICGATLLDISHEVPPGSIREGAFLLWSTAPACPEGTVHCAVIDPGVGTDRAALAIVAGGQVLVGPDNGLLIPAAQRLGSPVVYRLIESAAWRVPVSATFHGRDVFAPVAAHVAAGVPISALGIPAPGYVDLTFSPGRSSNAGLDGEVLWVDAFGNVVTTIPGSLLVDLPLGAEVVAETQGASLRAQVARTFGDVAPGEGAILVGSDGVVEIAVNRESAASRLGAVAGAGVHIRRA